jgi:hypothetical protein
MRFVRTLFVVSLFASVMAYGHKCHSEDVELAQPMPGFYEHMALKEYQVWTFSHPAPGTNLLSRFVPHALRHEPYGVPRFRRT